LGFDGVYLELEHIILVAINADPDKAFESVLDRMNNLVCLCKDQAIEYINPVGLKMLGYKGGVEIKGKKIVDFLHPDYAAFAELSLRELASEQSVVSLKLINAVNNVLDVEMWVSELPQIERFMIEVRDITSHIRAAKTLRSREQWLEGVINTVADGVISIDDQGDIRSFNPAAEQIFGFSAGEMIGKNLRTLVPEEDPTKAAAAKPWQNKEQSNWVRGLDSLQELTGRRKSGDEFVMEMAVRELQQGEQLSFTGIVRDITERKRIEEQIRTMAHFDNVTSLPNRNLLSDRLEEAIKRSHRGHHKFALLYVDLNKFKPINDELGHDAGDKALLFVAGQMKECVRETDTVARVGGDEFVVLLENVSDLEAVEHVAEKLLAKIAEPIGFSSGPRSLGAAMGIALHPEHGESRDELMTSADKAMYVAKEAGNSCFRVAAHS
jgi:diguanylate cyclase (GGDEF)-like protein/PAS domain S-box-containing protein